MMTTMFWFKLICLIVETSMSSVNGGDSFAAVDVLDSRGRRAWTARAIGAERAPNFLILAQRHGFSFEGVFRQAAMVKGRNRDTAWYAAIDSEWPALCQAFLAWLDPGNFDENGQQRTRLSDLTRPILKRHGWVVAEKFGGGLPLATFLAYNSVTPVGWEHFGNIIVHLKPMFG
jgi:hypothetical protein